MTGRRASQRGVAALTITAAALAAVLSAGAQSAGPQTATVTPPDLPAQGTPTFQDRVTGNWWGQRQRLWQAGITLDGRLVLEGFSNFEGGLDSPGFAGASTFDLSVSMDTQKSLNWPGGTLYVDLEDHAGKDPSTTLVGDLQVFDKLNSAPYLQVFVLWYQQRLLDGRLRIKVGKVDANSEFSVNETGLSFLNSSAQVSPTVFVLPTTPAPMPGVNVSITPAEFYYAGFGAYYANSSVGFGNFTDHPQDALPTASGSFFIGETGLRWQQSVLSATGGSLKVGAWGHTGTFTRLDGEQQQGATGLYTTLNQTLWQPDDVASASRGVRSFLEYGRTQSSVNIIDWHAGGGITWTGPLDCRPDDLAGLNAEYAHISPEAGLPRAYELALEGFYRFQVTRWAEVMPDIQYIINPGGEHPNALVGTLRLTVHF